jgi:hypothetical protein
MTDVTVLQTVRLKGGMADAEMLAELTGRTREEAEALLGDLALAGQVLERRGRYRISPEGRDILERGLADERGELDGAAVSALYEEFTKHNHTLKQLANDWQMRDGQLNDHTDSDYDAGVMARLGAHQVGFAPLGERIGACIPRLAHYLPRLHRALERVHAGDPRFFLSPAVDSYHQAWFELHEDLLNAAGLDRRAEAAAGRAE